MASKTEHLHCNHKNESLSSYNNPVQKRMATWPDSSSQAKDQTKDIRGSKNMRLQSIRQYLHRFPQS